MNTSLKRAFCNKVVSTSRQYTGPLDRGALPTQSNFAGDLPTCRSALFSVGNNILGRSL
jgi:hypothetical protein